MEFHKLTSEPQSFISASQMQRLCLSDHSMIEAVDAKIISESSNMKEIVIKKVGKFSSLKTQHMSISAMKQEK